MEERLGEVWEYGGPAASRLWEKSAIGVIIEGGKLLLSDSEVLFCHNHRGISIPTITGNQDYSDWIAQRVHLTPNLLQEAAILEALRVPGNKVVLSKNANLLGIEESGSWAIRWSSDCHPSNHPPISEVLWFHSKDELRGIGNGSNHILKELLHWCNSVSSKGRIAEVLVIDEEQSVVTYRIQEANPNGQMSAPNYETFRMINDMGSFRQSWDGAFFPEVIDWPSDVIGIPLFGGRQLDKIECELVRELGAAKNADNSQHMIESINDTFDEVLLDGLSESASILLNLWMRGLNTRSGFKYGTTWRCYPGDVGDGHAPWLIVDPNNEGPANWADACLSSRLASGVNKQWIYPMFDDGRWRYLEISRPPSDSRWSNPNRQ